MKKFLKKTCSAILAAGLTFSSIIAFNLTQPQAQEQTTKTDYMELYNYGAVVPIVNDYNLKEEDSSLISKIFSYKQGSVEQAVYNGLSKAEPSINISSFHIKGDKIKQIMQDITNTCPDLFYVGMSYSYNINSNNEVTTLIPKYIYSGDDLKKKKDIYNSNMKKIMSKINNSWSDLEKIVFVHDYLCQNFEYDNDFNNYDAYSFFSTGKGVCQAYTSVFSGIMKELNIDVSTATSDSMNHIWNVVKLNGKWYHIDVTWDDPTYDKFSLAYHNNLLVSDTEFQKTREHHDWVCNYKCNDATYDNYYWMQDNITSPFKYLDGKWYYAKFNEDNYNTDICAGNLQSRGASIYSLDKWYLYGTNDSFMISAYCGMDIHNNTLYFNSCDTIFSYKSSSGVKEISRPDVDGRLCGLRINDNTLTISATKDYNKAGNLHSFALEAPPAPSPIVTINPEDAQKGDVNLDGQLDLSDVTMILKAALKLTEFNKVQLPLADVDGDSQITLNDTTLCLKMALKLV